MRLIDADELLEVLNKKSVPFNANVNDAILTAPTVDAVEVVRCKDCKWVRKAGTLMGENPVPVYGCHNTGVYVFEDGYCDAGERKENVD